MVKSATQKRGSALALPDPSAVTVWKSSLVPQSSRSKELTRDERQIYREYRKQRLVIETQAQKTVFGQTQIAEIHEHASHSFFDTASRILETKAEAHGTEAQQYVEEFSQRQLQLFARHLLGTVEVGATNIGVEINRSLYVSAPEPTFWERVFGKE